MESLEERRTEHLLLRRPVAEDVEDLIRLHLDPQVMATLGGVRTEEHTRQFHELLLAHWREYGFGLWIARDLESQRFAGRGGLHHIDLDGRDEIEVAYAFAAEFWSRGLATELARESVRVAFDVLHLPELVCFTMTSNLASQRVMEKAGFRFERRGEHAGLPHVFYRLKRGEI